MDILPIEVIFYQSLLLIINLYYKLSIFIKNQQKGDGWLSIFILLLRFSQDYVVYPRHSDGVMRRNN